jgi:glycosyltransferase involved in cell wall biosynthesis
LSASKKILIVTYYWPPSGGSGVQRWLKFVKYLPSFGWKPFVLTPENPAFAVRDPTLSKNIPPEAQVMRLPIWEPYDSFQKLSRIFGSNAVNMPTAVPSHKPSVFQRFSTWIRGNFFIPDPRKFWVTPAVKFLEKFVRENEVDVIITTGPPHSIHLIGLNLKRKQPSLRWLADFRDPWSEWGLLDSLQVGKWARKKHAALEAQVLAAADEIITITPFYARRFSAMSARKVWLLTNGYDEDDFKNIQYARPAKFTIRHVGIVNEKCDPRPFLQALEQLAAGDRSFSDQVSLEFIGDVHPRIVDFVSGSEILRRFTKFSGNIPHQQLIELYGSSSLLLLILTGYKNAEGYMPGKLFEYLATGLPILATGPVRGDAGELLADSGAGQMFDADDMAGIKKKILAHFQDWASGKASRLNTNAANQYSRKAITKKLTELLAQESL